MKKLFDYIKGVFLKLEPSTKQSRNLKLLSLFIIFSLSALYAGKAYYDLLANNEYSKTITAKSLKLQKDKTYLFSTTLITSKSADTIIIPIENKVFPDSLCTLSFDQNEWKLTLGNNIRVDDNNDGKVDEKDQISNPLLPWCCTQETSPKFFFRNTIINEIILINNGIKFNYYSGTTSDRFGIKLKKKDEDYFLTGNIQFLGNSYPISKKQENLIELNFCNYTDTIDNKFVFSFPFLGTDNQPERHYLNINNEEVNLENANKTEVKKINSATFEVNNIQFELKENYSNNTRYALLGLYLLIVLISVYNFIRLYLYNNKHQNKNLIVKEQSNILSLRVLLNCIILLGFPLLILNLGENLSWRDLTILALIISLNINWLWLLSWEWLNKLVREIIEKVKSKNGVSNWVVFGLIMLFIAVTLGLIATSGNQEKLFGIPILHITKFLYVLLPFAFANNKDIDLTKKFKLTIPLSIVILSLLIASISRDFATPIFTLFALFLIEVLQQERLGFLWDKKWKKWSLSLSSIFTLLILFIFGSNIFSWFKSKSYRLFSTTQPPDHNWFNLVDEGSKQTVANQIYLLKTTYDDGLNLVPDFTQTVILPTFKSTFFSDYAVLWSSKIGGFPFLFIYFFILVYLSYCVITLLIVLNKKIPLHSGKMVSYNPKMVLIFNILLSLFLVQYIYTFLSNLWLLPLTGQSPGVLCPSIFELIFHILLINSLYFFISKRSIVEDMSQEQYPTVYTKVWKKAIKYVVIIFVISLGALVTQHYFRVFGADDEMKWKKSHIVSDEKRVHIDSLEYYAKIALKENNKTRFKLLYNQSYNTTDKESDSFRVTTPKMRFQTNRDSLISNHKRFILTEDNDFYTYKKSVNSNQTAIINNPYYSGAIPNSTTINFSLQKELNIALENWANKINNADFKMIGGSIIIANNNNGHIKSSVSFPFLFNENKYHLKNIEDSIRKHYDFRFKYHTINDYVNFSEFDAMPGSIVKPLLAYSGLMFLPENNPNLTSASLNYYIGHSNNKISHDLLKTLSTNIDTLNQTYDNEFGFIQFYNLNNGNIPQDYKILESYAIGNQNTLTFKNIVQAYTRIKTGRKVKLTYYTTNSVQLFDLLTLSSSKLDRLRTAMTFTLKNGTAKDVGQVLRNKGVNYDRFLSKTGSSGIENAHTNKTSSFILVTENFTIGIQLYGTLPPNELLGGSAARHLFINIINTLLKYEILVRS